jgi:hypothetical protein
MTMCNIKYFDLCGTESTKQLACFNLCLFQRKTDLSGKCKAMSSNQYCQKGSGRRLPLLKISDFFFFFFSQLRFYCVEDQHTDISICTQFFTQVPKV